MKTRHRYSRLSPLFLATVLPTLLAACATPRYQTFYRYEPPPGAAGVACLERCEQTMMACKGQCAGTYQACLKTLEPQVEGRYLEALKRFETELEAYRLSLEHYEFQLSMGWHNDPWWFGYGSWYPWPAPVFFGQRPVVPSRAGVLETLRRQQCDRDCGCQPIYDRCYLECGGRKVEESRCIANCPAKEPRPNQP